jgi:hypothetical protein
LNAFIHSCGASFTVGDDSFIVNCCALAVPAKKATAAIAAKRQIQFLILAPQFCIRMNRHFPDEIFGKDNAQRWPEKAICRSHAIANDFKQGD